MKLVKCGQKIWSKYGVFAVGAMYFHLVSVDAAMASSSVDKSGTYLCGKYSVSIDDATQRMTLNQPGFTGGNVMASGAYIRTDYERGFVETEISLRDSFVTFRRDGSISLFVGTHSPTPECSKSDD